MDTVAEYRFRMPLSDDLRAAGAKLAAAASDLDDAIGWKGGVPYPGYRGVAAGVVPVSGLEGVDVVANGDTVVRIRREGDELVVSGAIGGLASAEAVPGYLSDVAKSIVDEANVSKVREQTLCGTLPMVVVDGPDTRVAYVDLPQGLMKPYFSDGVQAQCRPFSEYGHEVAQGCEVRAFRYDGVAFVDPLLSRSRLDERRHVFDDGARYVMSQLRLASMDVLSAVHYYALGRSGLSFDNGLRLPGVPGVDIDKDGSVMLRDGEGSVMLGAYVDVNGRIAVAFDDSSFSMRPLPQPKSHLVTYVTTDDGREVNIADAFNSPDRNERSLGVTAMTDYFESVLLDEKNIIRYSKAMADLNEAFVRDNVKSGLAAAADVAFAAVYLAPGTDEFDAWLKGHDEDFFNDVKREDVLECCRKLDPVGMGDLGSVAAESIQHTLEEILADHIEVKRSLSLS